MRSRIADRLCGCSYKSCETNKCKPSPIDGSTNVARPGHSGSQVIVLRPEICTNPDTSAERTQVEVEITRCNQSINHDPPLSKIITTIGKHQESTQVYAISRLSENGTASGRGGPE